MKKAYESPELIEYGTVEEMTQSGGQLDGDTLSEASFDL